MKFLNRSDAGRQLAERLTLLGEDRPIVLALPRGGVPVAVEVARALGAPLDVIVARKLGAPHQPELAIGAVSECGAGYVDERRCRALRIPAIMVARLTGRERRAVEESARRFRGERALPDLVDRTVILVDDGQATGATARAAVRALETLRPRYVALAVPVASAHAAEELRHEVDAVVTVIEPAELWNVGRWYADFSPVSDEQVCGLLAAAAGGTRLAEPERVGEPTHDRPGIR
ncbi:MAG: phosphoribosyltransferase [Polyangia bacterium]